MVSSLIIIGLTLTAQATEVDSFTYRGESVPDATAILNAETQWRITAAVQNANRSSDCVASDLRHELGQQLRAGVTGFYMVAPLEFYANYSSDVPRLRFPRSESIYRDLWIYHSIPITLYPLGNLIRVNNVVIAGDKFSHFFNVGWEYFKRLGADGDETAALEFGRASEAGLWGMTTTGVFSYADLVSNYDGMIFWRDFVLGDDPNDNAYVECVGDQWVEIRSFRWEDWVNTGWDEAINCSVFADRLNDRVMNAISNPIVEGAAPECLAALEFCDEMRVIYGDVASQLITPLCESLQGDE